MTFIRFSSAVFFLLVATLVGCGSGNSGSGGGTGGGGVTPPFQARPFPGDFFAVPPSPNFGSTFPGNVVYDPALKEFFFSNSGMNEVEAYSTVDGHRVGAVTVPGPVGLSLSPDGTQLAVGTTTPYLYFVNPAALHVIGQVAVPSTLLNGLLPTLPFLMAAGPMLIEAGNSTSLPAGDGALLSYDPTSGAFTTVVALANGGIYGLPARSLDGNYLAVPTNAKLEVYSAQSQTFISSSSTQNDFGVIAANPDGSQFATTSYCPSAGSIPYCITFWNRSLQQQAQYTTEARSIVYSRDGKYLYVRDPLDVIALNTQTGLPAGYQGLSIEMEFVSGTLWDTDETNRVYGTTDLGAFVASVAQLQSTAPQMPIFNEGSIVSSIGSPNEGPPSGGTQVQFLPSFGQTGGNGILSGIEAYFGSTPATSDAVEPSPDTTDPNNSLTATAPPAAMNGPVTVLLTDTNNNAVFLPNAYSYGPRVDWISPSASSTTAPTPAQMVADGLAPYGQNETRVTINGATAPTTPTGNDVVMGGTGQFMQFTIAGGNPGWADLTLSLGDGTSETTKNMVQFLAQDVTLTSAAYTSAVYDSTRDRFYLTGADNTIGVFDPNTQTLLQPMQSSAVSSGAVLGSLALTPDNSKLLVSDPADHSVIVFDLTSNTSTAVNVLLPSDGSATVSAPMPVAAMAGDQAFVVMTPWAQNEVRQIDLSAMTVRVRTDFQNVTGIPVAASTIAASADGSVALLGGAFQPGSTPAVWQYRMATDGFSAPGRLGSSQGASQTDQGALNSDGTVLGMSAFILDQNLNPLVPLQGAATDNLLPGGGGLLYSFEDGLSITDTRNGRQLLTIAPPPGPAAYFGAFATDPTGKKLLVSAGTSLNYYELAVVPLAVGTVTPAAATPGTALTIRGNGFVAATTATIAGRSASCTFVDGQTLQCAVPNASAGLAPMTLSNPDGQIYSIEGAVTVQ